MTLILYFVNIEAVVITQLANGDEGSSFQVVKDVAGYCGVGEFWSQWYIDGVGVTNGFSIDCSDSLAGVLKKMCSGGFLGSLNVVACGTGVCNGNMFYGRWRWWDYSLRII